MMTEEMMKQMPHMMGQAGQMMGHPMATGAMMAATGFAAGRGLLGTTLLRNPLALLAVGAVGGVAAGFLLFKYQKENLNDLMATAEEKLEGRATPPAPAAEQPPAA